MSSSPTKHGEIMAMGIPVITNSGVGDVAEIVKKYDAGFVIDHFTDEELLSLVNKVAEGKQFDKAAIRKGAEEFYSLEKAVNSYREVYDTIFKKSRPV